MRIPDLPDIFFPTFFFFRFFTACPEKQGVSGTVDDPERIDELSTVMRSAVFTVKGEKVCKAY